MPAVPVGSGAPEPVATASPDAAPEERFNVADTTVEFEDVELELELCDELELDDHVELVEDHVLVGVHFEELVLGGCQVELGGVHFEEELDGLSSPPPLSPPSLNHQSP